MEEAPIRGGDVFLAILAYLPLVFLIPLMARRRRRFVLFHARQGLYAFSVFLVLTIVFVGLFAVAKYTLGWGDRHFAVQTLAVLIVMTLSTYVATTLWMLVGVLQKKMPMLPILGDLAGER